MAALRFLRNNRQMPLLLTAQALLMAAAPADVVGQQAVFIVRHAEKASDSGDTPLSEAGRERAKVLASLLKNAGVTAIYTSDALRTRQTAEPLAALLEIEPIVVQHGSPDETHANIKSHQAGGIVLVVGHSNTIDPLIKKWNHQASVSIGNQFDNIFVIVPQGDSAGWVRFKYGNPTP